MFFTRKRDTSPYKILICGDSFSADWTVKYEGKGWPNLLSSDYNITNIAQAGCSEYHIYKQILTQKLDKYDKVIVAHTSPYRMYVENHPVHANDPLHCNSSLIYTDIKEHSKNNPSLKPIIDFYEQYFNEEYAQFTHNLICEQIDKMCPSDTIHISNINCPQCYKFNNMINFHKVFLKHRGLMNHFNDKGNNLIYKRMIKEIEK